MLISSFGAGLPVVYSLDNLGRVKLRMVSSSGYLTEENQECCRMFSRQFRFAWPIDMVSVRELDFLYSFMGRVKLQITGRMLVMLV